MIIFNHVEEEVIVWQATYKHTEKTALFPFINDNPGNLFREFMFSVHLKYVTEGLLLEMNVNKRHAQAIFIQNMWNIEVNINNAKKMMNGCS